MKCDTNSINIDQETSELIVKICFMVTDLKHQSETEELNKLKKALSGSERIKTNIDNMLGSEGRDQFIKNLMKSEDTIDELLNLYAVSSIKIPSREEMEDTLKDLKKALGNLRQKVSLTQN